MNDNFGFSPTNTVQLSGFDVLTLGAVKDPLINVNKLATMDLEESYVAMACDFLKECNTEIADNKIKLYKAISESDGNYGVVLESFSDFFTKVKDVIDKFLKFIKSLFQRFITTLMGFVSSDKYITKHKKDFSKFKDTDNFNFTGYNYTFPINIPSANAILEFNNSLFEELYSDKNKALTLAGVKDVVMNLNFDDYYDTFRAKVLGNNNGTIYTGDFSEACFRLFRNGELDTEEFEVTSSEVRQSLNRFLEYKKTKSNVERDQKNIDEAYNKVKKQIQDVVKRNGDLSVSAFLNKLPSDNNIESIEGQSVSNDGLTMSGEIMAQINMYVKAKVDQIQECSNIHILAFSAKLDAMKECYIQDRNILYTALSRILRTDNARKEA